MKGAEHRILGRARRAAVYVTTEAQRDAAEAVLEALAKQIDALSMVNTVATTVRDADGTRARDRNLRVGRLIGCTYGAGRRPRGDEGERDEERRAVESVGAALQVLLFPHNVQAMPYPMTFDIAGARYSANIDALIIAGWTGRDSAAIEHHIEGVDHNILLHKRVLYNKSDPTQPLTKFEAGTDDDVVIRYYMEPHTDLLADGITLDLVEHVGSPSTDFKIDGRPGESIATFMRRMAFNTGAIFYIDPDGKLVFCDVDTPNAPFGLSDQPTSGEIGGRNMEILHNGSRLVNDALVWGAGQGTDHMIFSRSTDTTSITTHGRWQTGLLSTAMFRQETADRTASSYVYGSPQSKRGGKDDAVSVLATVFEPGLRVAQKLPVRSTVFSFEDVIPLRRRTTNDVIG